MAYSIILVDDHNLVRRGLAALLRTDARYCIIAEASNGEEALTQANAHEPDIMILDISMPRLNGLETVRRLKKQSPRTRILMLSMHDDVGFVAQAIREGAGGYILKDAMDDELFQALDALTKGEMYISAQVNLDRVEDDCLGQTDLTAREREVLQLIVDGHTTQQIAHLLSISPHTATRHRANLMQKLNVHNQMELVRCAVEQGLVIFKG